MYSSDDGNDGFDLAMLALVDVNPLSYVRPVKTDKGAGFGVFSADGTQLAVFSSREAAYYAARQHNLDPAVVH